MVAHGEIFTIATDRGEPQRVSETAWKEQDPRWSPNGKWIAFVSDRSGREEVYLADEPGKTVKKISDADCDKSGIVWSPDSKSLMWSGSDHKLRMVEADSGKTEIVAESDAGNVAAAQFSPDGKYISFARPDKLLRAHVWVKELANGQEHMLGGEDFLQSSGARWTPDGKKLLLIGGVGAPAMAALNRTVTQLYSVALQPVEKAPDSNEINSEEQAMAASNEPAAGRGGRGGGGAAAAPVQVKIVWDGIDRRITQLSHMAGSVSFVVPAPDSRTYLFSAQGGGDAAGGGSGMYTIGEDGTRLTRLNTTTADAGAGGRGRGGRGGFGGGGEPQWGRDSRSIYFLQGGGIYSLAIGAAPAADTVGRRRGPGRRTGRTRRYRGPCRNRGQRSRSAPHSVLREDGNRCRRRAAPGLRRSVAGDEEPLLRSQDARGQLGRRERQIRSHASARGGYRGVAQPDHGDDRRPQRLAYGSLGRQPPAGEGPPEERIATRYPGFDLEPDASGFYKVGYIYRKVRRITTISRSRPATSSSRSTARI